MIHGEEMEKEFIYQEYLAAREEGTLQSLSFNEDEFEILIDRLVEDANEEDVLEICEIAFEKFPYSANILTRLCDSLILLGNPDKALEILEPYADSFAAESSVQFLFARANIAKQRFVHARDYFYKALEYMQEGPDVADSVCALAQDCIEAGNYMECLYYLNKASRMATLPYEYYNDYAFCYDRLDEPQKAIEYYNKFLDKDSFNDTVWFNLGTVHARLRNFEEAIEAFEYSIALNASNSSSLYNLAVVFMNLQRFSDAASTFERFVEIDPDVLGKMGLGEAYIRLERFDDAMAQFRSVMEDGSTHPAVAANKAVAHSGIDAVKAIIYCRNGEFEAFKQLFTSIMEAGGAWVSVVYDMLPFLQGEDWFLEFLKNIKKQ